MESTSFPIFSGNRLRWEENDRAKENSPEIGFSVLAFSQG